MERFYLQSFHRLPLADRRLVLILLDLMAVNTALLVSLALRPEYIFNWTLVVQHPLWFFLLSFVWVFVAHTFDAYDVRVLQRFFSSALAAAKSGVVSSGLYLFIPFVTPMLPTSRFLLLTFPFVTVMALLAARALYQLVLNQPLFSRRVLVIGTGQAASAIADLLNSCAKGTYEMIGFVDARMTGYKVRDEVGEVKSEAAGLRFFLRNGSRDFARFIIENKVTTLILAVTDKIEAELLSILTECMELGVEVVQMATLYEQMTGQVPIEHVQNNWYVAMPLAHPLTRTFNRIVKRSIDLIAASLGMVLLVFLLPFITLAIYLDSRGPIFYTQERVGQGGRVFKAYKFRSMVVNAEKGEAVWAQKDDPRVTRVGRILRKTHIDELPQFFNIVKGDMSLVGPRPERPEFVNRLRTEIPFYPVRHAVRPGITGWAQVRQGYTSSKDDTLIKLQYDLYYIKHWSLWLDIVILLKTVVNAMTLRGR